MKFISTSVFLLLSIHLTAQIKWNFDANQNASSGVPANITAGAVIQVNNFGTTAITGTTTPSDAMMYYAGASGSNNIQASAKPNALNKNTSTYFAVTLTPATGYSVNITSISFGTRSTGTGATNFAVYTSIDNYSQVVLTGSIDNTTPFNWYLKSTASLNAAGAANTSVTIRIYGYGNPGSGSSGTANWKLDDLSITAVPVAAVIKWDGSGSLPTTTINNVSASNISKNQAPTTSALIGSSTPSSGYTGSSGGNNYRTDATAGAFDPNTSTYFETTLTPVTGFRLSLSSISFGSWSSRPIPGAATGPKSYVVDININGFSTQIGGGFNADNNWQLIQLNNIDLGGSTNESIVIKIYGVDGDDLSPTNKWLIDDLQITAAAVQVLPVTLIDFTASQYGKQTLLKWISAKEENLKEYQVQVSDNGKDFNETGYVKARNESKNEYAFSLSSQGPKTFFRLKMVDLDGKFTYSKIISTQTQPFDNIYKVSGLPVLRIPSGKKQVTIYDMQGRRVLSTIASEGDVSVSSLTKGQYYFVECRTDNGIKKIKFFND